MPLAGINHTLEFRFFSIQAIDWPHARFDGVDAIYWRGPILIAIEKQDAARRDRYFVAGLGIASDAFGFLAHLECSER